MEFAGSTSLDDWSCSCLSPTLAPRHDVHGEQIPFLFCTYFATTCPNIRAMHYFQHDTAEHFSAGGQERIREKTKVPSLDILHGTRSFEVFWSSQERQRDMGRIQPVQPND